MEGQRLKPMLISKLSTRKGKDKDNSVRKHLSKTTKTFHAPTDRVPMTRPPQIGTKKGSRTPASEHERFHSNLCAQKKQIYVSQWPREYGA
eukprot:46545-Pelagomonas_calceolata.AAC.4